LVRGVLCAPEGKVFIGADLANIEGRLVAWLANDQRKLQRFRDYDEGTGPDIYLATAADMYNVDIKEAKPYRMIGKVAELALGYQGSIGAFLSMASVYGVDFTDEEAKAIVDKWRLANFRIKQLWYATQDAAIMAVTNRGMNYTAGRVTYVMHGDHLKAVLPSGRALTYPYARTAKGKYGLIIEFEGYPQAKHGRNKTQWGKVDTYGGKLVENNTQALARDVLAENMLRIDKTWPIVLHVHDEVVSEVEEGSADLKAFEAALASIPDWADGLPLSSEGFIGKRYRK
jgi:DNA polymerase